ncbi:unnamed protein product [Amoebophrya sp. A25]|nr:unnamed protein product [Amoebophrya sp. A25]|eukprot:GSA25T00022336001.1
MPALDVKDRVGEDVEESHIKKAASDGGDVSGCSEVNIEARNMLSGDVLTLGAIPISETFYELQHRIAGALTERTDYNGPPIPPGMIYVKKKVERKDAGGRR